MPSGLDGGILEQLLKVRVPRAPGTQAFLVDRRSSGGWRGGEKGVRA